MTRAELRQEKIKIAKRFLNDRIIENEKQVVRNRAYVANEDWYRRTMITPYHEIIKLIDSMYKTINQLEEQDNGY